MSAAGRRRPGWVGPLVAGLVAALVVGVLAIGDKVFETVVEDRVGASVVSAGVSPAPGIDIQGWPFTAQVVRGDIDTVVARGGATTFATDTGQLAVLDYTVTLRHVRSDDRFATMVADSLEGTVRMGWSELGRLSGFEFAAGDDTPQGRRLTVQLQREVLGRDLVVTLTGLPTIADGALVLTDVDLQLADYPVPPVVADQLTKVLLRPIPLTLPYGLVATGIEVQQDGIGLTVSGEDVRIR